MPIPIDHLLERTQRRAAVINPSTIIIIIITITSMMETTKSPAGQLEHYQTILKATQLLVQKERQKALVMKKILQHAPRIPDTPSDFEALISGKDACLKYKPPPVPEFVPPPPPADAREHKHPYSNDDRGTKRIA